MVGWAKGVALKEFPYLQVGNGNCISLDVSHLSLTITPQIRSTIILS